MIKVYANRDASGCGYWRLTLPAKFIDPTKFAITIGDRQPKTVDWLIGNGYQVLWTQRNHDIQSLGAIVALKAAGLRVIYDCDDDLFNVSRHNPAAKVFNRRALQCVRETMLQATVVTTTTRVLAKTFPREDVVVIPNAVDPSTFRSFTSDTKWVVWAGSRTHWQDFKPIIPAIRGFLKAHPEWRLFFMGYAPLEFHDNPQVMTQPWASLEDYLVTMNRLEAEFASIPLDDNAFNRAKSNLKWLEFSAAGIPCIVPRHEPYTTCTGCTRAAHMALWREAMEDMLQRPVEEKQWLVETAQQEILFRYNIHKVAKEWERVLAG